MGHNLNFNESTGRYSFFSVKEKAWHNLGQVVTDYPTSAEAIKHAGLDYQVVKSPLYTKGNDIVITANGFETANEQVSVPNYFANVRSDNNAVLGVVGKDYHIIQNRDAFTFFDAKIGFKEQPYLIYQHHDAGHPHLHITAINVQANGKRITMQNIGRDKSEPARKEIEQIFNLVKAESQKKKEYRPEPILGRVNYGKTETKKAIENALNFVVNNYRYASLPELNAVLKLYNIVADKGTENSRVAKHNGLLFHALDEKGNPIGMPIKASSFYNKPTLKNLDKKFVTNEAERASSKGKVKMAIDLAFARNNIIFLPQLIKLLKSRGIDMVLRQNAEGIVYGVTYVDHTSKSVFNGSAIGKEYSAKGLQDKCAVNREKPTGDGQDFHSEESLFDLLQNHKDLMSIDDLTNFLDVLMRVEDNYEYVAKQFNRKRKKRGRNL